MSMNENFSRRQFLTTATGTAVAVVGFPYIVGSSALGKDGSPAPSERVTMGCIGVGWQGGSNMGQFLREKDCRIVAICDVDKKTLQGAVNNVNKRYGSQDCAAYNDFRELLARTDIDCVSLGLPDHWHAIPAIEAARSGKDIYGEKPLSHDLREGRAMCDAVKRVRPNLADRELATLRSAFPLRVRARPQRPDRQGSHSRGRAPFGTLGLRQNGGPGADRVSARGLGL